jgi:Na+-driven multidrug efflux pump
MAGFVARFGPAATAAYGVGVRLMSVTWSVAGAVGQATATGVGQNLGAETPDRAARVAFVATAGTMGLLLGATALVVAFPAAAIRVFVADPDVVREGVGFLRIVAPSWAFFGGVMTIQGAFRGAGHTKVAMALSFLSRWILRVPVALVLAFAWTVTLPGGVVVSGLDVGVEGIWWAYATAAFGSFLLAVAWFRRGTWREGVVETGDGTPGPGPGPAVRSGESDADGDAEAVDD